MLSTKGSGAAADKRYHSRLVPTAAIPCRGPGNELQPAKPRIKPYIFRTKITGTAIALTTTDAALHDAAEKITAMQETLRCMA